MISQGGEAGRSPIQHAGAAVHRAFNEVEQRDASEPSRARLAADKQMQLHNEVQLLRARTRHSPVQHSGAAVHRAFNRGRETRRLGVQQSTPG